MTRQQFKEEMSAKPEAPRREEPLNSKSKNTTMQLNGQNLRLAAKNVRDSKTPGLHLSATHGEEDVARLTPTMPTQDGAVPGDSLLFRSPLPDSEWEGENLPPRRPIKLAPLELPKEKRGAQRLKIRGTNVEPKANILQLDVAGPKPCPRKIKGLATENQVKPLACTPAPSPQTEPVKGQRPRRSARSTLVALSTDSPQTGDRPLEEVVCRGVPAPRCLKPAPPLPAPSGRDQAPRGPGETACQRPATFQEAGRRRLQLRTAEHLEEHQSQSRSSTAGLAAGEGKLVKGGQGSGQRAERALREASRMLEKASKRSTGMEVSGKAIQRMDAAL